MNPNTSGLPIRSRFVLLASMKTAREIEILFRRLRLYDRLERRAEGLVRTIQRVMKERYGHRSRPFRNRAHARPGRKTAHTHFAAFALM
jgi:hypothetical protein